MSSKYQQDSPLGYAKGAGRPRLALTAVMRNEMKLL